MEELNKKLDEIIDRLKDLEKFLKGKKMRFDPDMTDARGASQITGFSLGTIYQYVRQKKIPFTRKGHRVLFSREKLIEWMPAPVNIKLGGNNYRKNYE